MNRRSLCYLIVDDDRTSNLICDLTIRKFDCDARVTLFPEPLEALNHISEHYSLNNDLATTVLFLDINMPVMSGFEFLDEFLKFDAGIRKYFIIYMLSSSIEDFKSQSLKYPIVSGFLSKPLRFNDLNEIFDTNVISERMRA